MFLHEIIFNNTEYSNNQYEFYIERNKNNKEILYIIKGDIACKILLSKNIKLLERIPKNNILKKLKIFKKVLINNNELLKKIDELLHEFTNINYAGKYSRKLITPITVEDVLLSNILEETFHTKNCGLSFSLPLLNQRL